MEGKQFSASRGYAIYVRDFLERYDADALRFYLVAAGPETQDTDFTWAEFVRRNNDELLANWGNLVNRTLTNAHRNFGEVPQPGELTEGDRALLATIDAGFDAVGGADRAGPLPRCARRGDAALVRGQPVRLATRRRGRSSRPTATAPAPSSTSRCERSTASRCSSRRSCRTARRLSTSCSATRAGSPGRSSSAPSKRRAAAPTTSSPATTPSGSAAGSRASCPPARSSREPEPLFKKLDAVGRRRRARPRVIDTHAHLDPDHASETLERARAVGRRPRDHRRDPHRERRTMRSRSPTRTRASTQRSASTPTTPTNRTRTASTSSASCSPTRARSRSARPASTTSASTRRTTTSAACSKPSSRSQPSSASRS